MLGGVPWPFMMIFRKNGSEKSSSMPSPSKVRVDGPTLLICFSLPFLPMPRSPGPTLSFCSWQVRGDYL